jgi:tetratricopeptide (TPR) repeat protein
MNFVQVPLIRRFYLVLKGLVGLAVIGLLVASVGFGPQLWRDWQGQRLERRCRELRDRKDWSQLAALTETWTQSDPGRANAWLFRAEAAEGQGQSVVAADFLFRVPSQDAKSVPAFMQGATILLSKANRPIEGVEALHKLLKREPRVADAHRHLIQYYALTLQRQRLLGQIRFAIENDRECVAVVAAA